MNISIVVQTTCNRRADNNLTLQTNVASSSRSRHANAAELADADHPNPSMGVTGVRAPNGIVKGPKRATRKRKGPTQVKGAHKDGAHRGELYA